jgi:hypothetical protein
MSVRPVTLPAVSNPPWDRRLTLAVVAVGAVAGVGYFLWETVPLLGGELSHGQMFGRDFTNFYVASVLAWQGDFTSIFDTQAFNRALHRVTQRDLSFNFFPYPPHGLWPVLPLATLPYAAALVAWAAATFALFALAACPGRRHPGRLAAVLLLAPASLVNLTYFHNGFLTAALLLGGLRLLASRPAAAGVLIGLLTYKPQFGLLLPFVLIAGGHWRAFASATVTTLALLAATTFVMGPDIWTLYLGTNLREHRDWLQYATGPWQDMTLSAFMAVRQFNTAVLQFNLRLPVLPLPVAYGLQAVALLAALAAAVWAYRRPLPEEIRIAVVVVGAFLATPYGYNYDMPVLAAALVMAAPLVGRTPLGKAALALGWLLPVTGELLNLVYVPTGPVVLGLLLAVLLRRGTAPPPRAALAPEDAV